MKWLLFLALLPLVGSAQGVKRNQYDPFLQKQAIELEPITLVSDGANRLSLALASEASDVFLHLRGAGWGATTIDENDELQFLLANDSSVTVRSVALQSFEPGMPRSTFRHRYQVAPEALQALSQFEVVGLRKFSFKEPSELRLPREAKAKLQPIAALFLTEMKKAASLRPLKQISPRDVYEFVGDSVQFCTRVFNLRTATDGGTRQVVLEAQPDFSSPVVNLVLAGEATASEAEKLFLNKEICVSGTVTLRNDVPTLVLRGASQLAPKTADNK